MGVVTFKPEITLTLDIDLCTILPDLTENTLRLERQNFHETLVKNFTGSCVYWTLHHRDSWRINDHLDVTCYFHFLCAQHVSDINIAIIRSLRLFCWITTLVVLFLVRCLLEFRCGWVGMLSVLQTEAQLQHVSNINIAIIRSLRLFCWITTLIVLFLVRCVLEFLFGWVGVVFVL